LSFAYVQLFFKKNSFSLKSAEITPVKLVFILHRKYREIKNPFFADSKGVGIKKIAFVRQNMPLFAKNRPFWWSV
jgi:hypothetical protein